MVAEMAARLVISRAVMKGALMVEEMAALKAEPMAEKTVGKMVV